MEIKKYFFTFFVFCFFCLVATSSVLAYGEADEIDLVGPQWAVEMVCKQIHDTFDGVYIQQTYDNRLDRPVLQFKNSGTLVVSEDVNPFLPLRMETMGRIHAWQYGRITSYIEYRQTDDKPFPRHSDGIQVHTNAPLGLPYWEVKEKPDWKVKVCKEISGPEWVVPIECVKVNRDHYRAAIPASAVRIWGVRDGSDRPVKTLELWTTPSFSCNY